MSYIGLSLSIPVQDNIVQTGIIQTPLDVQNGQIGYRTVPLVYPYNILPTDFIIGVTTTILGVRLLNLPKPSPANLGQIYTVKDESGTASATHIIRVTCPGFHINGAINNNITRAYGSRMYYS